MKPSIIILLISQVLLDININGCCNNKKKYNYKYEDFYVKYIENKFSTTSEKWVQKDFKDIIINFKKVINSEEKSNKKYDKSKYNSKKGFILRKIDWRKLKKITNLEWNVDINELKKQINFIEKISYIYELYFFLISCLFFKSKSKHIIKRTK